MKNKLFIISKSNQKSLKKFIHMNVDKSSPFVDFIIAGLGLIPVFGPFIQFGSVGIKSALKLYISRATSFEEKLNDEIFNNFDELLKNEEFTAKLLRIWNAVCKEHQKEKIERFAYFFNNSYKEMNYNEYDEYVNMLDDLSLRDIKLLYLLDEFYIKNKDIKSHDELINLWKDSELDKISDEIKLSKIETKLYYDRLLYKGMCSTFSEFFGQVFLLKVSPIYEKLLILIKS